MAVSKKKGAKSTTEAITQAAGVAVQASEGSNKLVAQHNALVNARFSFAPLQMRLFLALLSRIEFNDVDFKEHFVPASELVFERHGGSAYMQIDEMCNNITSIKLYIELLEEGTHKRRRRPKYDYIPLMAKAGYDGELGGVVATFNPLIMPYLLQLRENGNFTLAALDDLRASTGCCANTLTLESVPLACRSSVSCSTLRKTSTHASAILRCGYWTRPKLS
jgi:hypothetical protein